MAASCLRYFEDRHLDDLVEALDNDDLPCFQWNSNRHGGKYTNEAQTKVRTSAINGDPEG